MEGKELDQTVIIEGVTQAVDKVFVVDRDTGEVLLETTRNRRAIEQEKNEQGRLERWREARKLTGIADVRSKKDLEALCLGKIGGRVTVSQGGMELLTKPGNGLTKKDVSLAIGLIQKKLYARNYALVTNAELQELVEDTSGNYTRHLAALVAVGFCRVRNISKLSKLIAINPFYGYRGGDGVNIAALEGYYYNGTFGIPRRSPHVNFDEDGWLQAA